MDKQAAVKIIRDTFEKPFDKGRFITLVKTSSIIWTTQRTLLIEGILSPMPISKVSMPLSG